jgi:hypothetical protein
MYGLPAIVQVVFWVISPLTVVAAITSEGKWAGRRLKARHNPIHNLNFVLIRSFLVRGTIFSKAAVEMPDAC